MTLASLAWVLSKARPSSKRIWRTVAYLGRYANQSVSEVMKMSTRDIRMLQDAVEELLGEETATSRLSNRIATGG